MASTEIVGAGDLGSPELVAALADFSTAADAVVSALVGVVTVTATKIGASGAVYQQVDATSIPADKI